MQQDYMNLVAALMSTSGRRSYNLVFDGP